MGRQSEWTVFPDSSHNGHVIWNTHRQASPVIPSPIFAETIAQLCVLSVSIIHKSSLRSVASFQGLMMNMVIERGSSTGL